MAIHLPGALAQMLGKVLTNTGAAKADAKALTGPPGAQPGAATPAGPVKGAPIGETGVLTGVGYSAADRAAQAKNVHEKDTVARFLKDPELDKIFGRAVKETDDARAPQQQERAAEAKDRQDAQRADVRREDRAEEQKVQVAREAQREEAQRDQAHEKERERQREERHKDDEHGQPQWTGEDPDRAPDEDERPEGPYDEDPLGEAFRCKGELMSGERCLRKPLEGTAYCREHLAPGA